MYPALTYSMPFFISALFVFMVALLALKRRRLHGGWYLTLICLCSALWAASEGMLYLGLDIDTSMRITFVQYLGTAPVSALTLLFTLTVFGPDRRSDRKWIRPLSVAAAVIILLVWTNPLHHLVYTNYYRIDTGPVPMLGLEHGVVWWVIIGYQYLLLTVLTVILVRQIRIVSASMLRAQAILILSAVMIVWLLNAVYVTGNSPVPNMDLGPMAFVLMAVCIAWGFFRYHLLDIVPIAKAEIFYGLKVPILVVDDKDRILEINPAGAALFGIAAALATGKKAGRVLQDHPALIELPRAAGTTEVCLELAGHMRFFDLSVSILNDRKKRPLGRVIVLQEVTQYMQVDDTMHENERLQGVLEMAGAVCHDMSQPLMAIMGYLDLIAMELAPNHRLSPKIAGLTEQSGKLSEIIRKLMRITPYNAGKYMRDKISDADKCAR
ncbi:MAG: hypothetical protein VR64_10320 [Desulfatitalea sp. BRH_c12]|nr:MAG: hypothetical protein VR64_10320 [Desulfatitalea sp. BRH_c12]